MIVRALLVLVATSCWCLAHAADRPIIHFPFDESLADLGPFGLEGKIDGDEVKLVPGFDGNALFIGGTLDWVTVALPEDLDLTAGASLEVWFKRADWINPYSGGNGFQTLVALTSDMMIDVTTPMCPTAPPWALLTSMTHYNKEVDETDVVRAHSGRDTVPPNTWIHAAVVYDPDEAVLVIYKNGKEVDRVYGVPPQPFNYRQITIGTWYQNNQAFRGHLDDLKVYNYPRKAVDILLDVTRAQSRQAASVRRP